MLINPRITAAVAAGAAVLSMAACGKPRAAFPSRHAAATYDRCLANAAGNLKDFKFYTFPFGDYLETEVWDDELNDQGLPRANIVGVVHEENGKLVGGIYQQVKDTITELGNSSPNWQRRSKRFTTLDSGLQRAVVGQPACKKQAMAMKAGL